MSKRKPSIVHLGNDMGWVGIGPTKRIWQANNATFMLQKFADGSEWEEISRGEYDRSSTFRQGGEGLVRRFAVFSPHDHRYNEIRQQRFAGPKTHIPG